jgi:hypothetical protein
MCSSCSYNAVSHDIGRDGKKSSLCIYLFRLGSESSKDDCHRYSVRVKEFQAHISVPTTMRRIIIIGIHPSRCPQFAVSMSWDSLLNQSPTIIVVV